MTEIITKIMLIPEGMELDDVNRNAFAIFVEWRGPRSETGRGGYAVSDGFDNLSRAGKWSRGTPQPFQQRLYRWDTLEEALEMARKEVNNRRLLGKTWAEWEAERLEKSQ